MSESKQAKVSAADCLAGILPHVVSIRPLSRHKSRGLVSGGLRPGLQRGEHWRDDWTPDGWPEWRLKLRGRVVPTEGRDAQVDEPAESAAALIRPAPAPDLEPIGPDTWAEITTRRAVHEPSGHYVEQRWRAGRYRLTVEPFEMPADRIDEARRVLDGVLPRGPGRPAGGGLSGDDVFEAAVAYWEREEQEPDLDCLAAELGCEPVTIQRVLSRSRDGAGNKPVLATLVAVSRDEARRRLDELLGPELLGRLGYRRLPDDWLDRPDLRRKVARLRSERLPPSSSADERPA
jgi:hypothetical protein